MMIKFKRNMERTEDKTWNRNVDKLSLSILEDISPNT